MTKSIRRWKDGTKMTHTLLVKVAIDEMSVLVE